MWGVCVQGVGDCYTDPQVHSVDNKGYGQVPRSPPAPASHVTAIDSCGPRPGAPQATNTRNR